MSLLNPVANSQLTNNSLKLMFKMMEFTSKERRSQKDYPARNFSCHLLRGKQIILLSKESLFTTMLSKVILTLKIDSNQQEFKNMKLKWDSQKQMQKAMKE